MLIRQGNSLVYSLGRSGEPYPSYLLFVHGHDSTGYVRALVISVGHDTNRTRDPLRDETRQDKTRQDRDNPPRLIILLEKWCLKE